jgi:hypothetical protein
MACLLVLAPAAAGAQETGLAVSQSQGRSPYAAALAFAWFGGQGTLNPNTSEGVAVVRNTHGAGLELGVEPRHAWGLVATVSGALQSQSDCAVDVRCPWPNGNGRTRVPDIEYGWHHIDGRRTEGAWQARVGYRFNYFTFDAGVHVLTDSTAYDRDERRLLRPAISVRWGSGPSFFRSGIGPYNVPTLFGMSGYVQGQGALSKNAAIRVTTAYVVSPDGHSWARLDAMLIIRIQDALDLGLGGMANLAGNLGGELRCVTSYAF